MLLSLALPAVVDAQFNSVTYYTFSTGYIGITGYTGPGGSVTIPDTINGYPVTEIGDGAFSNCTKLTSVYFQGNPPGLGSDVFEE